MKSLSPFTSALLLGGVAIAQGPVTNMPIRGMMPSFPTGFVMTNSQTRIQKKEAGLPVVLNKFQRPVNGVAWWDETEIQRVLTSYLPASTTLTPPVIDAMSSQNDLLPLVRDGNSFRISQANVNGWAALYMALEDNSGAPLGVYGYYFDNPSFPNQLRNGLYMELEARELDPTLAAGPAAMDVAMGLLVDNNGRLQTGQQEIKDRVYFSLTDQSAQTLWNELGSPVLAKVGGGTYTPPVNIGRYDGATIFVAEYDSTGTCIDVKVAEDSVTLQLPQGTNEIDALGVGMPLPGVPVGAGQIGLTAGQLHYVISTEPAVNNEELLVVATVNEVVQGVPTPTRYQDPLRDNNGNSITANGGSLGRVRALCSQDPVDLHVGGAAFFAPCDYADPTGNPLMMGMSAAMMYGDNQTDSFLLTGVLTGWVGAAENSFFWLAVQMESGPATGFLHYYGPWFRSSSEDAITFEQKIDVPWMGYGAPPGPYTSGKNSYRMWVYQQTFSGVEMESIRGLVFREM
ncbi:MAG: hypothetical protein R3F29_01895 [Planctomycetota bacterium]